MKLFRVLVLVIALVAGGVAAYLAINLGPSGAPAPTVVELAPQITSQDVLVAASDIVQGAKITPENVRWQRWPDDAMNGNYIQKQTRPDAIQQLQNSVVRNQFVAGEPIREVKLARPGSGFLSAILPPGMRAIAVRISANNTAGGFILPGDRVDVVETVGQQGSADGPATNVSRTLLTNVKVLAIDQSVQDKEGEAVVVGKTATLELEPSQVELVTAAEASGTLSLSLRSIADTDEVVSAREQKQSNTVRIFRAGRSQVLTTQ
jgi:pilus assembly protein CpaB